MAVLAAHVDDTTAAVLLETRRLSSLVDALDERGRLPLLEITLPALRWQWVTADLGINAYNVTASQTFEVKFGDYFYSTRPTQN